MTPITDVPPARSGDQIESRLVVAGVGGGEGASTVTALLATLLADAEGRARAVLSRADDPIGDRLAFAPGEDGVIADVGPHGADETLRPGDVAILVCAATTGSIERARARLVDADARGLAAAALVVCARTPAEQRSGRVRARQAALVDRRIVPLAFDPALADGSRVDLDRLAPASIEAARAILGLLGIPR